MYDSGTRKKKHQETIGMMMSSVDFHVFPFIKANDCTVFNEQYWLPS